MKRRRLIIVAAQTKHTRPGVEVEVLVRDSPLSRRACDADAWLLTDGATTARVRAWREAAVPVGFRVRGRGVRGLALEESESCTVTQLMTLVRWPRPTLQVGGGAQNVVCVRRTQTISYCCTITACCNRKCWCGPSTRGNPMVHSQRRATRLIMTDYKSQTTRTRRGGCAPTWQDETCARLRCRCRCEW